MFSFLKRNNVSDSFATYFIILSQLDRNKKYILFKGYTTNLDLY